MLATVFILSASISNTCLVPADDMSLESFNKTAAFTS